MVPVHDTVTAANDPSLLGQTFNRPWEQLSLLDLNLFLVLALAAPCEQLTGTIQQLPLSLAHLDGMDGVISGDLLDPLAATDRLHGDPGLVLRAVGAALAHWWEPRSAAVPRLRG